MHGATVKIIKDTEQLCSKALKHYSSKSSLRHRQQTSLLRSGQPPSALFEQLSLSSNFIYLYSTLCSTDGTIMVFGGFCLTKNTFYLSIYSKEYLKIQ
jgi:hypothetical protein